jgi:hypothetical protein
MTANIDPIAFVVYSAGNSAHARAFLEDNGFDLGTSEQLIRGRQSGGTRADNNCLLLVSAIDRRAQSRTIAEVG